MSRSGTYTRREVLGLMAAWGFFLAGCSQSPSGPNINLEKIPPPATLVPGKLTVATSLTYAPMYIEQTDGTETGFAYAMSEAVGTLLSLKVDRIVCDSQREVIEQLRQKKADLGGASYERGALPSDVIACNGGIACNLAIIDHDGRSRLRDASDLSDLEGEIIVQNRAVVETWVKTELEPDRYTLESDPEEILQAIREDRAVVGIVEEPVALYYLESLYTTLQVEDTVDTGWNYGFLARSDDQAMMDAVNQALAQLEDEGVVDSLETRWFGNIL